MLIRPVPFQIRASIMPYGEFTPTTILHGQMSTMRKVNVVAIACVGTRLRWLNCQTAKSRGVPFRELQRQLKCRQPLLV